MRYQVNKPQGELKLQISYSGFEWFRIERWTFTIRYTQNVYHAVRLFNKFRFMIGSTNKLA